MESQGKDVFSIPDKYEAHHIAYTDMAEEADTIIGQLRKLNSPEAEDALKEAKSMRTRIQRSIYAIENPVANAMPEGIGVFHLGQAKATRRGSELEQELSELKTNVTHVHNYHYDHSMNFNPRVGSDESGPRFKQD